MVKIKTPKSERRKVSALLKQYYGGFYTTPIIKALADEGLTIREPEIYAFFGRGTGPNAQRILDTSYKLIEDAKIIELERKERLNNLSRPQKSAGL